MNSSIVGKLVQFHILVVVSRAAKHTGIQCCFRVLDSLCFDPILRSWLTGPKMLPFSMQLRGFLTMGAALSPDTFLIWMSFNIVLFGNKEEFLLLNNFSVFNGLNNLNLCCGMFFELALWEMQGWFDALGLIGFVLSLGYPCCQPSESVAGEAQAGGRQSWKCCW